MQAKPARVHVKTTVPPGESLVGILPYNIIRLERVKLSPNEHVQLLTANHVAVPFDGAIHDLRAKVGGPTLCVGNHVSLFVRNLSDEPQPIELQIGGSTIDDYERKPGEPAPDIGCKIVLGMFAQELEPEPWHPNPIPIEQLLAYAADHYANAKHAAAAAFDQAVFSGTDADDLLLDVANARRERLHRLLRCVQSMADAPPETLPEARRGDGPDEAEVEASLGFSPEQWEAMRVALKERNGWTDAELDARLADAAQAHPSFGPFDRLGVRSEPEVALAGGDLPSPTTPIEEL